MPKEEWGVKRACPKCSVRFYDLRQDPMTCPACGSVFDVASLTQQKTRTVAPAKDTAQLKEAVQPDVDEAAVVLEDDADADDLADDLDEDLLDDDDDDTVALEEIADVPADDDDS